MRRLLSLILVVLTATVVAVGCGDSGGAASAAAEAVPAGAIMYGEVSLKPEADQQEALDSIAARFPGEGGAGERMRALVEKILDEEDAPLSFAKDIQPWLGDEAAFFFSEVDAGSGSVSAGALVATDDEDAAMGAVKNVAAKSGKRYRSDNYKDHEYLKIDGAAVGTVDGWLVLGTPDGFKAVVDTSDGGKNLTDDAAYEKAMDGAAEDRLGLFYMNGPKYLKTVQEAAPGFPAGPLGNILKSSEIYTASAGDDILTVEALTSAEIGNASPLFGRAAGIVEELPAGSWLALGQADLGTSLDALVDYMAGILGGRGNLEEEFRRSTGLSLKDDVLSWMGDYGVFVRGTTVAELDGALFIETKDEARSARLIEKLGTVVREQVSGGSQVGPLTLPGGGQGLTLTSPELPQQVHLFQREGRVVLAYGDKAAEDALGGGQTLADDQRFNAAKATLGDVDLSFYVALDQVFELADNAGAAEDEGWRKAKPYLEPLAALVAGGRPEEGDRFRSVFGVTFE
jgi:hypothetical protein